MNRRRSVLNGLVGAGAVVLLAVVVLAGLRAARDSGPLPAAYPGPDSGETGLPPYPQPDQPTASPPPVAATWDPSLPTLIPPDPDIMASAMAIPPCCDENVPYFTPLPSQAAIWTQQALEYYGSTLPPGAPTATPLPPLEYLEPSGEWVTFTHPTYRYSFEYPSNWFVFPHDTYELALANWDIEGFVVKSVDEVASFRVNIYPSEDLGSHPTLADYVQDQEQAGSPSQLLAQQSYVSPQGYEVVRQERTAIMPSKVVTTYLTDGDQVFVLVGPHPDSNNVTALDRILDSFVLP